MSEELIDVTAWFQERNYPYKVKKAILSRLWGSEDDSDRIEGGLCRDDIPWMQGMLHYEVGTRIDLIFQDAEKSVACLTLHPRTAEWAQVHIPYDIRCESDIGHAEIRREEEDLGEDYAPDSALALINFFHVRLEEVVEVLGMPARSPTQNTSGGFEFL